MSIFKSCDVRGIVDQEWGDEQAVQIGASLGRMLQRRSQHTVVVGGDFRRSTIRLKSALVAGLLRAGIKVCDVGQAATPVVQFAAREFRCPNFAIVTASHNPGIYNGIKFQIDGCPPVPELVAELERGMLDASLSDDAGVCRTEDVVPQYEQWVIASSRQFVAHNCDSRRSGARGLPNPGSRQLGPIVVDTMGGAFTDLAPRVLTAAGFDARSVDDRLDPDFVRRDPNPARDVNLRQVIDTVEHTQAELGLALDGDGDRVIFVNENGGIVRPEQVAVLLIKQCFERCTVVYDLKCASMVASAATARGGMAVMRPSGHGFIKTTMLQMQAELGVEVSGHHFFGVLAGGDDGLFTALVILGLLDFLGCKLTDLLETADGSIITPDLRIPAGQCQDETLETIARTCGGAVSRIDGVRAEYEDGGWGLARASITEPVLTFRFEGRDEHHLASVVDRFLAQVPALRRIILEKIP